MCEENNKQSHDSTAATLTHIRKVNANLLDICSYLLHRAKVHDESKLHEPEKSVFDQYTYLLYQTPYMSEEYKAYLEEMRPAIEHHESHNEHHPGYYKQGIDGMSLLDIIEMFCDWKAASERTKDGNFLKSILTNRSRFNVSDQLHQIFINTWFEVLSSKERNEQVQQAGISLKSLGVYDRF